MNLYHVEYVKRLKSSKESMNIKQKVEILADNLTGVNEWWENKLSLNKNATQTPRFIYSHLLRVEVIKRGLS